MRFFRPRPIGAAALATFAVVVVLPAASLRSHAGSGGTGVSQTSSQPATTPVTNTTPVTTAATTTTTTSTGSTAGLPALSLKQQVGQLLIATYQGQTPPASLLRAIRLGQIGAVILMGDNTTGGVKATKAATTQMQAAAQSGGNAGLLIMTDQEGGQVKRLPGPPQYPAADMSSPTLAYAQGRATGVMLKQAGVNVDLAPVADVVRVNGFIEQEQRSFGRSAAVVAPAACAFASGLAGTGVAYTLKHFPGLGDAVQSTDNASVSIKESASAIHADDAAYRQCGHSPLALVMVSSASYTNLTGSTPAVLDPKIYAQVMKSDGITALPISDDFEAVAMAKINSPARTALNAGLDMVMYADYESVALSAYSTLLADAQDGSLSRSRVRAASERVLELKQQLGLVG